MKYNNNGFSNPCLVDKKTLRKTKQNFLSDTRNCSAPEDQIHQLNINIKSQKSANINHFLKIIYKIEFLFSPTVYQRKYLA